MNESKASVEKRANQFMERLGLSYDALAPKTKSFLLDMVPVDTPLQVEGSAAAVAHSSKHTPMHNRFNRMVDHTLMQKGGWSVLPSEYFGADSHRYTSPVVVGGGGAKFFTISDVNTFSKMYEKRFMRKLRLSKAAKEEMRARMDHGIQAMLADAVHQSRGVCSLRALKDASKKI
jgi:hypothetical protein